MAAKLLTAMFVGASLLAASGARAGVSDPVPLINGTERAKHVYSVTGVTANAVVGTVITCTSLEKTKDMRSAVEVFSENGPVLNDITSSQGVPELMSPGETVTVEISRDGSVTFTGADASVTPASDVLHASARVVATSSKIACSAFLADDNNDPPTFVVELPMVAKTKQKGD